MEIDLSQTPETLLWFVLAIAALVKASEHVRTLRLPGVASITSKSFRTFQIEYLSVYLLSSFSDWLQGPYVYDLYEAYGFTPNTIKLQFAVSFGASMMLGPKLGALADKYGRKRFVLLYAVFYGICALLHHFNSIVVLTLARILGGASASLLYTVFDSWMCHEHRRRKFDDSLLQSTYSLQAFFNSLVAIVAGLAAQKGVDALPMKQMGEIVHFAGSLVPFEMAIVALAIAFLVAQVRWPADKSVLASGDSTHTTPNVLRTLKENKSLLFVGAIESLFESSLFLFAFSWAPAMKEAGESAVNYGTVFAVLMAGCMLGSQVFGLMSRVGLNGLTLALPLALLSHGIVAFGPGSRHARLIAFVLFEVAVGIYFPSMGVMKSVAVPETLRTTLYSINRVPINAIVLTCLTLGLSTSQTFTWTTTILSVASVSYIMLQRWPQTTKMSGSRSPIE